MIRLGIWTSIKVWDVNDILLVEISLFDTFCRESKRKNVHITCIFIKKNAQSSHGRNIDVLIENKIQHNQLSSIPETELVSERWHRNPFIQQWQEVHSLIQQYGHDVNYNCLNNNNRNKYRDIFVAYSRRIWIPTKNCRLHTIQPRIVTVWWYWYQTTKC